ncbi:MAG: lipid A phosphate methyltransferase [Rhodospirillales bacterium]|nr:lipid A phosphate methyltransferase [Rhodospirillales bacterium]
MRLIERLEREGAFLFRWRSFLPLVVVPAAVPALYEAARFEAVWGPTAHHAWVYACMALSFVGLGIRWMTVGFVPAGTSGRRTRSQQAEVLNTTGMYSIVRNPLYLGNFLAILGLALSTEDWRFVLLVCSAYWLYIERVIAAEERFLAGKFGARYEEWARDTPAFIPSFSRWRSPAEAFSLRTVLRREYNGVLAVAASYFVLEAITDLVIEGEAFSGWLDEDRVWVWLFVASTIVFASLRTLKKHTHLLHVPGR